MFRTLPHFQREIDWLQKLLLSALYDEGPRRVGSGPSSRTVLGQEQLFNREVEALIGPVDGSRFEKLESVPLVSARWCRSVSAIICYT